MKAVADWIVTVGPALVAGPRPAVKRQPYMNAKLFIAMMRRPLPGLFILLLAACATPALRAQNDIIHPRGTPPAGAPVTAPASGLNSLFLLGTAAAAAGAGWWLWQKRRTGAAGGATARLVIAESRPLGSRQYLVVADYDGKKFLLGVCPGSIEMLTPLDSPPPPK